MIPTLWRRKHGLTRPFSQDMNELLQRFWGEDDGDPLTHLPEVFRSRAFPAVNMAETEDAFVISVDCPGLEQKDLNVEIMGNHLVISGERRWEESTKEKEFRRVESQYGRFERRLELPGNARVTPGEVDATLKKGVLTLQIPKVEKTPTSKIEVHAAD